MPAQLFESRCDVVSFAFSFQLRICVRQFLFRFTQYNFDKLVKSQKSYIFIVSEEIRIQSLQIVISVSSLRAGGAVRSVANCIFYEAIIIDGPVKSLQGRHSRESGSPELIDFTGFPLSGE